MMRTLKHSSADATILVVNGDDTTGNLLQDVLAKEGYDVHHAGSAQEMWQVLDQQSVDLILLRLHLTDAFGLDLIPRLAEHSQKPTVIILSGPRDLETAIECMRLGAYDYLTKPVAPGPFLIAVERF
jgi:DNA-binding response OmpR family regulator